MTRPVTRRIDLLHPVRFLLGFLRQAGTFHHRSVHVVHLGQLLDQRVCAGVIDRAAEAVPGSGLVLRRASILFTTDRPRLANGAFVEGVAEWSGRHGVVRLRLANGWEPLLEDLLVKLLRAELEPHRAPDALDAVH